MFYTFDSDLNSTHAVSPVIVNSGNPLAGHSVKAIIGKPSISQSRQAWLPDQADAVSSYSLAAAKRRKTT
jgi:hypothetical protein